MAEKQVPNDAFCGRAAAGDEEALAALFDRYRHRLRTMVKLRLDRRLQGRVDPSDVVQEAFLDLARELPSYSKKCDLPLFLWMRLVTGQRLTQVHRRHLGAEKRDAARDVSLYQNAIPQADSVSLAAELLASDTSAVSAAVRTEVQGQLQEALDGMEPVDREIIVLRHFEELDNRETSEVLRLSLDAARKRYVRALKRLQSILRCRPGLMER